MIRSAMRASLRNRVNDINSITWTDAQCDASLNEAANLVCNFLTSKIPINLGRTTFAITTNGVTKTFPLTAKANIHKVIGLFGGAAGSGGRIVPEDQIDQELKIFPDGKDTDGRWLYYLIHNPSDASSPWSVVFLTAPPTGTWSFIYNRKVVEVPTGAGAKSKFTLTRPVSGNFTISWHGIVTEEIAYNATASEIKTRLLDKSPPDGAGYILTSAQVVAGGVTTPTLEFENTVRNLANGTARLELPIASAGSYAETVIGSDGDLSTYNDIPSEYHEAIIAAAATSLLGYDGSGNETFASAWQQLLFGLIGT
jgi:hypothetical protein